MKRVYFLMIALAAFALSACSAIEDAATIKVDIPDFAITLPATVTGPVGITRVDPYNFSGSYTLNINQDAFSDIQPYISLITGITISEVTVTITKVSGTGGTASNITLSATGVTPNVTMSNFTFGTAVPGNAALKTFLQNTIMRLKNGDVTVSIVGTTDVAPGTELRISIELSGVEVTAKTITF